MTVLKIERILAGHGAHIQPNANENPCKPICRCGCAHNRSRSKFFFCTCISALSSGCLNLYIIYYLCYTRVCVLYYYVFMRSNRKTNNKKNNNNNNKLIATESERDITTNSHLLASIGRQKLQSNILYFVVLFDITALNFCVITYPAPNCLRT